jgi:hypothetical protein
LLETRPEKWAFLVPCHEDLESEYGTLETQRWFAHYDEFLDM